MLGLKRIVTLDEKKFKLLEEADWGKISKELLACAANWSRKYPTLGHGEDPRFLVLGVSYEDIVQEVIDKAFAGIRNWPDGVELVPYLKMHVKSIIDALAKSKPANQETPLFTGSEEGQMGSNLEYGNAFSFSAQQNSNMQMATNPEDIILKKDEIDQQLQMIFDAVEGDEELELIVLAMQCGCEPKPRFLAEELSVPIEDVYQQVRRLRRLVDRVRAKNERT